MLTSASVKRMLSINSIIILLIITTTNCSIFQNSFKLKVKGAPPNADVFLDGERVGVVGEDNSLTIEGLKPGTRNLKVTRRGFTDFTQEVTGKSGETIEVIIKTKQTP